MNLHNYLKAVQHLINEQMLNGVVRYNGEHSLVYQIESEKEFYAQMPEGSRGIITKGKLYMTPCSDPYTEIVHRDLLIYLVKQGKVHFDVNVEFTNYDNEIDSFLSVQYDGKNLCIGESYGKNFKHWVREKQGIEYEHVKEYMEVPKKLGINCKFDFII